MDELLHKKKPTFYKESIMLPVSSASQIHLRRIYQHERGTPVLMVPGIAEDGHIFYSNRGQGLAYELAAAGYDVFVADMRGKGKSWPQIGKYSDFGQFEMITEDLPAYIEAIKRKRGDVPQLWVSHAWGGVLQASYLARYGMADVNVIGMVHFGVSRRMTAESFKKKLIVNFLWEKLGRKLVAAKGYFPAVALKFGSMNESAQCHDDYTDWMSTDEWIDRFDHFDYGAAIKQITLPPSLYFGSKTDNIYGNLIDIRHFLSELGSHDGRLIVLGRECGNPRDYSHVEMLLHPGSVDDHFQLLLEWLFEVDQRQRLSNHTINSQNVCHQQSPQNKENTESI